MNTKLNKNSVSANIAAENPAYSAIELLKQKQIRESIICILNDEVIGYRIDNAMFMIANCYAPFDRKDADWDGTNKRKGSSAIIHMLGIADEDELCSNLHDIVYNIASNSHYDASMVAEVIFQHWEFEITKFFNANK